MATIIEGAKFTLTEEAAQRMVENGLIFKCIGPHNNIAEDEEPIYHRAFDAPDWFGFATLTGAIVSAEQHVEEECHGQGSVPAASDAPE